MSMPILRRSLPLALAVLAAVTATAHGRRAANGPVDARIVNGLLTGQYASTGVLLTPGNPSIASMQCTGTLIGCDTFLTAAHCVCNGTGADCQGASAPHASDYLVFFQHAGFFSIASIAVHPTFDFPVGDVAVIKLATPVTGIAPTPINTSGPVPAGTHATIVGFGRSGDPNFDYGIKRVGSVVTAECAGGVSNTTSVCFNFTNPLGPPGSNSDTCNGDSGGPLFVDFGCGPVVAGTTSGGDSDSCLPNDAAYDGNTYFYHDWIQTQGGADLSNAFCGAMPQAGDANTTVTALTGTLDAITTQVTPSFTVPAGTTRLRVALNGMDDGPTDFDLYVKQAGTPTTVDYDCAAATPSAYGFCEFVAPTAGPWHLLVRRKSGAGIYQVTVTTFGSGAPGSGTNGHACDDGNACTSGDVCQTGKCTGAAVADGTSCDDGSGCTSGDACSAGTCVGTPTPINTCKTPFVAGKAQLTIKNSATPSRDNLLWKWGRGSDTQLAEFGSPLVSGEYELCVFDRQAGVPKVVLDTHIPAGAGWTTYGKGYKFRDKTLAYGGVNSILLKPGTDGLATVTLHAKGQNLEMPPLPLLQGPSLTVQLLGSDACWTATYSSNNTNSGTLFKAKSD